MRTEVAAAQRKYDDARLHSLLIKDEIYKQKQEQRALGLHTISLPTDIQASICQMNTGIWQVPSGNNPVRVVGPQPWMRAATFEYVAQRAT